MSNQQIGVNMKFTADTSQAKAQLQDLQSSLTKIMNVSRKNDPTLGFSKEIQNAINLTAELKTSLENATNVKTGQLDLSKFNDSLIKNKRTLKDYQEALTSLGPAGNQAFSNLASSIMKAEIPLKRTNKLLTDFAVTMKNTAKWQISSNIMHGLEGSIKSAYGYAQDLNRSLNDIRIVTGASVNEMARFAEQANKSARALSTTTTDYTKASLIYYQQGLSDAEVQERTDITIKMANAAGQSAQIISDQMTAVWNNFDNGSKSLEYYADVMTALGAATASSTDEIANGIEKFAAISETVGLSYEYATAALATVTDKTRQSAEVVGTAFKTMFARIQGLKLGETLEDGTDLNQYSEALLAVGINIKDANGELKDMDNILNEMATVWEKLNRDEQVALAQKVAGVRQYNQLMSLMENWDAMEVNLEIANNSEGELQKQADIYAESWEAATDRAKAAAESIYQTLIDDEFFIDLTNALEKVLVGVKKLMDSMGGLPGVLTLVGSIATNVFSKQLADGFDNLIYRVRMSTAEGRKEIESLKQEASELLVAEWIDRDTTSGQIAGDAYREQGQLSGILLANAEKLSAEEQKQVQYLMDQHSSLVSQVVQSGEALEIEQKRAKALERRMLAEAQLAAGEKSTHKASGVETHRKSLAGVTQLYYDISSISLTGNMEKDAQNFQKLEKIIAGLKNTTVQFGKEGQSAIGLLKEGLKSGTLSASTLDNVLLKLEKQQVISMNGLTKALQSCGIEGEQATRIARELRDQYDNLGVVSAETSEKQTQLGNSTKMVAEKIRGAKGEVATLGTMFASTMNAITSFGFAFSSIKGIIDTLNNEDLTFFEKFVSVLTSASMITTSLISVLKTTNEIRKIATAEETKNTLAKTLNTAATWLEVQAQKALNNEMQEGINLKKSVKAADGVKKAGAAGAGAATSLSAAFSKFTSALGTAASAAAKFIPIITAITAALGALTYMVHYTIEEYNKDATAAKKAEEAAKDLAEAYSQTKSKYEEMISSMENYKTARDGLNSLAKGTQEYRDQLNKANEEALKLIETLGLIKGSGYDIVNGEIIINKDSEDYQTKTQEFEYSVQKAQAASYIANAESEKATAKSNQTTLARTQNQLDFYGTFENNRIDQLTQQYKKMGSAAFDASNLISLGFDTANEEYIDNVKKQVATNIEASDSMENAMELASQAILNLDKNIEKSSQKETVFDMGENAYNLTYATEKSNIIEQMTQEKWQFGIASGEQKNIWEEYIKINKELQGLTDLNVTNFKADGSVEYEYTEYDDSGKKTTKTDEVSAEVIAIALANERTADKLITNSDTLNSLANRLVTDETINKEFASFTTDQNLNDLTYKELSSIETPESLEALAKEVEEIFSPDELSALGYKGAEDYAAAFILGYSSTMSDWKGLEEFADYSLGEAQSLSHISSQTGQSADEVTGYYDELNEEEKSIFLTLDFDENQSKENWDRAIANIKEEKIEIQIEAKTSKAASEYGLDADQLNDVAKAFSDMDEIMGDNTATTEEIAEAASDAAVRYVRLQDAVIDLSENYEDYKDVLTDIQDSSSDVDKAMILNSKNGKALKGSLAGLIGTTEDLINTDLISAIDPEDFRVAAAGDEAAIEKIRGAFIDVQAAAIDTKNVLIDSVDTDEEIIQAANNFKTMMAGLDEGATIDIDNSPFLQALIQSSIAAGATEADIINKLSGFDIDIDTVSFHDSLESAKAAAEACGGDVVEALSYSTDTEVETNEIDKQGTELGYNEEIVATPVTKDNVVLETEGFLGLGGTSTKTLTTTHYEMDKKITTNPLPTTEKETTTNVTQTAKQGKGQSKYAVVGGAKKSVGSRVSPSTTRTAGSNLSKGKSGGGGGSKPKPAQPTKKKEIVDRYQEIDDKLADAENKKRKAENEFNRTYGKEQQAAAEKMLEASKEYRQALKDKQDEAKTNLKEDKRILNKAAGKVGIEFEYDGKNITNYTESLETLYKRLREMERAAGSEWTEAEEKKINAFKEEIEAVKEAYEEYEATKDLLAQIGLELDDLKGKASIPVLNSDLRDYYKEINDLLDDIEDKIDRVSLKADQATGAKKVKRLRELAQLEEDRLDLIKQQQEVNKEEQEDKRNNLTKVRKTLDIPFKFTFDKNKNITNYDEVMDYFYNQYIEAYNKYNKENGKGIDEDEQKILDGILQQGEMAKEAMDAYAQAVEEGEELKKELIEAQLNAESYFLEAITYTIELNIEADQRDLKYLDYELAKLEDQAFSTAESIDLITQQYKNLQQQSKTLRTGEKQILSQYLTEEEVNAFYEGNMKAIDWSKVPEEAIDKLNEYSDELLSVNEQLLELRKTMDESVIKAFEEWSEEMKGQIELFDHYDSVISSYQNIIDLTGQNRLGISDQEMSEYNQLKVDNANNKLASSKTYYDETQEKINSAETAKKEAQQRLDDATAAGDEEAIAAAKKDIAMWDKTLETMYEENRNAEQAYLADWEAALEASRDAFLAETDMQLKALEKQMAGTYGNLDAMHEEFNQKSEINERYLQDYERMYELSKLNRDLTKQMDETSNVKAKQELAKLQEEILGYQEEGRKMSKYDLEYLQKRYDLKLAEIAMEEAQQAKSQVRLTRDADGNFSYTYTADEESMAEAQQTYEDKLFEITDLSNNHIEDQTEQLLSTQQEYIDKLAEIHQKAAEGQYATTEEYQKALDDCTAYYTEKMRYHGGEIDKATLNNAVVYADDYATYEHYIGRKLSETERLQREMDADIIEAKAQVEKLQIEKQAALDEIHRLHAEGYYATEEEYQAALAKVDEDYGNRINNATVKVNTLVADRVAKYGEDSEAYSLETAKKAAAEEGFVTSIKSYLPELEDAHQSVSSYVGGVVESIGSAKDGTGYLGKASQSYEDLSDNIETAMKNAGTSTEEFKKDAYKKLISDENSVAKQSKKVKDKVSEMAKEITDLDKTITAVKNWQKNYSAQLEKIIKKNEEVIKSTNKMNQTLAKKAETQLKKEIKADKAAKKDTTTTKKDTTTTKKDTTTTKKDPEEEKCPKCGKKKCICNKLDLADETTKKGVAYAIWSGYWGNGNDRKKLVEKKLGKGSYTTYQSLVNEYDIAKKADNGTWEKDLYGSYSKNPQAKLKKDYGPDAFYTGGYTGAWGPDGKLAILHEKELVLNKQDTENMLKMVTMVRDIAAVLDLQAYQSSLAQLTANSLGTMSNTQKMFEQTVTIHAEFPDAVYATEIETALNNLVNSASQYANRKN